MNIQEARQELLTNWTDCYGTVTLNPAIESDAYKGLYDSENQLLWTGQALLLLDYHGIVTTEDKQKFANAIRLHQIVPGLFNRHPNYNARTVSWDEYNGLMYADAILGMGLAQDVVKYGKEHSWAYINENPNADGWKMWGNGRPLPYVHRIRQPRDIAFYKIMAGIEPTLLEKLWLTTAITINGHDTPIETSGNLMCFYRMMALDKIGYSCNMINEAHDKFVQDLIFQYGTNYLHEMTKIYFKREGHPFHVLTDGVI